MNKTERFKVMSRMKAAPWYTYCQLEAMNGEEVLYAGKTELAALLDISLPTLSKYLEIWQGQGLVREFPGGIVITQMDGPLNPQVLANEELSPRYFNPKKIIDVWCFTYENHYHEPCRVVNWGIAINQVKRLLRYDDLTIERTIEATIKLYDEKWSSSKFPRPTIGALVTFMFEQALPYADLIPPNDQSKGQAS